LFSYASRFYLYHEIVIAFKERLKKRKIDESNTHIVGLHNKCYCWYAYKCAYKCYCCY